MFFLQIHVRYTDNNKVGTIIIKPKGLQTKAQQASFMSQKGKCKFSNRRSRMA